MSQNDGSRGVIQTLGSIVDERLIGVVHILGSDDGPSRSNRLAEFPIEGIVLPDDGDQPEGVGDVSNSVVDVAIGRSPTCWGYACCKFYGFHC